MRRVERSHILSVCFQSCRGKTGESAALGPMPVKDVDSGPFRETNRSQITRYVSETKMPAHRHARDTEGTMWR